MSNARRFFPRAVSLYVALAIAFVFLMVAVQATTCPPPPKPLRILYQRSEKIVIARLETITDDKILEENEEHTQISVRHVFSVSSTLKGKPEPHLVIYQTDYRDKSLPEAEPETEQSEESAEEDETVVETEEEEGMFAVGKRLLLFLRKDSEGDGYSLVDYERGAKELTDADLRIYEKRIEEIGSILASPEKQAERTVEWLVRCAEEPATRWDGAYELDLSFDLAEHRARAEAERKEALERGEVEMPRENYERQILMLPERDFFGSSGDPKFARLLTNSQKERLTDALLNAFKSLPDENKSEEEGLSSGDSALLDLVARWDDERLVPALLANLRNSYGRDDYDTMRFMTILARLLQNEKLTTLAQNYEEIWGETDEEEEGEIADSETAEESESSDSEQETVAEQNESETTAEEAEDAKLEKTTYKQRREQILNDFIAECEMSLARGNETAKVARKH